MHVRTVRSLASTRFLGLGLCLLTLSLTGCPNDDAPPPVAEETPPQTARFAYVANGGSANVSAYTIHATTGALTAVVGSPFATGGTGTIDMSLASY